MRFFVIIFSDSKAITVGVGDLRERAEPLGGQVTHCNQSERSDHYILLRMHSNSSRSPDFADTSVSASVPPRVVTASAGFMMASENSCSPSVALLLSRSSELNIEEVSKLAKVGPVVAVKLLKLARVEAAKDKKKKMKTIDLKSLHLDSHSGSLWFCQ